MKKLLAIILALILALSMGLLAGCGGDSSDKKDDAKDSSLKPEDVFTGTWEGEINASEGLSERLASYFGGEKEDFEGDFSYFVTIEFDGEKATLSIDDDSFVDAVERYESTLRSGVKKVLTAAMEEEGFDSSLDDYIHSKNSSFSSFDDLIDSFVESLLKSADDKKDPGTFTVDGDQITVKTEDAERTFEYKIVGAKEFKLVKLVDGDSDSALVASLPVTFYKK